MSDLEPSVSDVLDALLDEVGDVEPATDGEYARQGIVFVGRPEPDVLELRLGEEITEAAMRTPNTGPSTRGPAWVRFAPTVWDDLAFDRLEAWFRVAWRLAANPR
jgi:hypothetical protein